MIDNLFNTKLKKALLGVFFGNSKRSFSIDELRFLTKGSRAAIAEAVREFAHADLLEAAQNKKGRRFYQLNSHFHLRDELRELVTAVARPKASDEVGRRLRSVPNLRLAVLSGIFTLQPKLPVDLLLVGDEISVTRLDRALSEIEDMVGQEVNYTLLSRLEYDDRRFMSDRLIRDVLDNPHLVVFNYIRGK